MKTIFVIAPHADDETLGCAGTILRYRDEGASIHWLIVTGMSKQAGFDDEQISTRDAEIKKVLALSAKAIPVLDPVRMISVPLSFARTLD